MTLFHVPKMDYSAGLLVTIEQPAGMLLSRFVVIVVWLARVSSSLGCRREKICYCLKQRTRRFSVAAPKRTIY